MPDLTVAAKNCHEAFTCFTYMINEFACDIFEASVKLKNDIWLEPHLPPRRR